MSDSRETDWPAAGERTEGNWWNASSRQWSAILREREEHALLVLTLVIGALVGLAVVAFMLLTERAGVRLYPAGGAAWRGAGCLCPWPVPVGASVGARNL